MRVGLGINRLQALQIHFGINLGRRQSCVAQQFLNRYQIGTSIEQMGSERMTQKMRTQRLPFGYGAQLALDDALHCASAQSPATSIEKKSTCIYLSHIEFEQDFSSALQINAEHRLCL